MISYIEVLNRFATSCVLENIAFTNGLQSGLSKQGEKKKEGKEVCV
jgi:hypothetical protein